MKVLLIMEYINQIHKIHDHDSHQIFKIKNELELLPQKYLLFICQKECFKQAKNLSSKVPISHIWTRINLASPSHIGRQIQYGQSY